MKIEPVNEWSQQVIFSLQVTHTFTLIENEALLDVVNNHQQTILQIQRPLSFLLRENTVFWTVKFGSTYRSFIGISISCNGHGLHCFPYYEIIPGIPLIDSS